MSQSHILTQDGGAYRIAFHIATPAGQNSPGLTYANALLMSGGGGTTVLKDGAGTGTDGGISTTEKAAIVAGTTYEVVDLVTPPAGLAGAALLTWLDDHYTARAAEVQATLQARLAQFGRTRG